MLFITLRGFLVADNDIAQCQLTALGIPKDDLDPPYQPLTVEQRVKLLEMEQAAEMQDDLNHFVSIPVLLATTERLRAEKSALIASFRELAETLREWASGHYCQTYNRGRGEGFEAASLAIEEVLEEHTESED